jgi:sugar lactone lactonase YvrE
LILHATPGGFGEQSGLDNPQGIALSGDGKSLYTASFGDSAVGRFRRER